MARPSPPARLLWRAVLRSAALRRRYLHSKLPRPEDQVAREAPGRSFADVGCMWSANGRIAFSAADAGASEVVGVDLMAPTPEFLAEQRRRGDVVRFVQGDLHDRSTLDAVGTSQVVFCSGVLYHAPHPLRTLEALRSMCTETLILWTATIPEAPGLRNGCVFLPHLDERSRRLYDGLWSEARHAGITDPFRPEEGYGNWFWGISRSAARSMLHVAGFAVTAEAAHPLTACFVARPR